MSDYDEIVGLMGAEGAIPRERVMRWMQTGDLRVAGALYVLTDKAWARIQPALEREAICDFILGYYMRCIVEHPPQEDFVLSRYQAAGAMAAWMKHLWTKQLENDDVLQHAIAALRQTYLNGPDDTKTCIVTGVLEHVFEEPGLVPLFESWKQHARLKDAYDAALQWGQSHRQ